MKNGNITMIVAVLAALVLGGGIIAFTYSADSKAKMDAEKTQAMQQEDAAKAMEKQKDDAMKADAMNKNEGTAVDKMKDEKMMQDKKPDAMMMSYKGKTIAGKSSPYLEFNKADYEQALKDNKIIVLDFYANWCPICRAEAPNLQTGFNGLTVDKVVGFRVNWQDDQTDSDEKALASQYKILSQHTKVLVKNGKEVSRSLESWDIPTFNTEINKVLTN